MRPAYLGAYAWLVVVLLFAANDHNLIAVISVCATLLFIRLGEVIYVIERKERQ